MGLPLRDVATWEHEFQEFCHPFMKAFGRTEVQKEAQSYLQGLLSPMERKTSWQIAEVNGKTDPQSTQRLLRKSVVDVDEAQKQAWSDARAHFGSPDGIFVVDESGVVKKGKDSVGVASQYCGHVGKVENCQIGVYLSYVSAHGHGFLDRRLYLPACWAEDTPRRDKAHVPEDIGFKTKPQLALEMFVAIHKAGFPGEWLTGDCVYGNSPDMRHGLIEAGQKFVLAVGPQIEVWTRRPPVVGTPKKDGTIAWKAAKQGPQKRSVKQVALAMQACKWKQLRVKEGAKGWITYEWAAKRVTVAEAEVPGPTLWLLVRRHLLTGEMTFYLCYAPLNTKLKTRARVASARWSIEQCFEEGKQETGLADYQVRFWQGWHRHTLLSMIAHLFLALLKKKYTDETDEELGALTVPEARRLLEIALPFPIRSIALIWHWSLWRRRHNQRARRSHLKRKTFEHIYGLSEPQQLSLAA
jgi:SRSO17 transposase